MRGEHTSRWPRREPTGGPPPHARGTRGGTGRAPASTGTTPACAGNTRHGARAWRRSRDHPRMRGEHTFCAITHPAGNGTTPACAGNTDSRSLPAAATGDHPRMRGDHRVGDPMNQDTAGPPPHARGPLGELRAIGRTRGTTPACAGTTRAAPAPSCNGRDHPRMRGDHTARAMATTRSLGPPPHARGPHRTGDGDHPLLGTTPACAGTTNEPPATARPARDHPRMRGDHPSQTVSWLGSSGPPPHARGPRRALAQLQDRAGTTPACAGTTRGGLRTGRTRRDHPRMRGDHTTAQRTPVEYQGPPPHARGPQHRPVCMLHPRGTTPACAGTTGRGPGRPSATRDHPRMRGDHLICASVAMYPWGPPPHARGPQHRHQHVLRAGGTTPACAGTTGQRAGQPAPAEDHPRMRGDHRTSVPLRSMPPGPPPHARGPPGPGRQAHRPAGTIPACAGTTQEKHPGRLEHRDHPRMRGDHGDWIVKGVAGEGPPPHARGPRTCRGRRRGWRGTTPACAGTTWKRTGGPTRKWDHPRMRGDHRARPAVSPGVVRDFA